MELNERPTRRIRSSQPAMRASRGLPLALVILVLALVGCGGDDRVESPQAESPSVTTTNESTVESGAQAGAELSVRPPGAEGLRERASRLRLRDRWPKQVELHHGGMREGMAAGAHAGTPNRWDRRG